MKKLVYIFLSIVTILSVSLLSSCESKRAAKKITWLKERGYLQTDTIRDTVRGFQVDTFVRFDTLNHTDTLTVEKNGVRVVTVTKWRTREQWQTITQRDTIRVIPTIKKTCPEPSWWHNFWKHGAIALLIATIIFNIIGRLASRNS